jgi:hypothetical protein
MVRRFITVLLIASAFMGSVVVAATIAPTAAHACGNGGNS